MLLLRERALAVLDGATGQTLNLIHDVFRPGLKALTFVAPQDLEACFNADPRGRVRQASDPVEGKIRRMVDKHRLSTDLLPTGSLATAMSSTTETSMGAVPLLPSSGGNESCNR